MSHPEDSCLSHASLTFMQSFVLLVQDLQKTQTETMDPIQNAIILLLVTSVGFALYRAVASKVKGVQGKR